MKNDLVLPWKVVTPQVNFEDVIISTADGFYIARVNQFAQRFGNKQHIKTAHDVVRAVNNFDALLDASQSAYAVLSTLRIILKPEAWEIVKPIKEKLEKAIANAEK